MADVGLYGKYTVQKNGELVEDCFVLRPDRDSAARVALLAYAYATEDVLLRSDLIKWAQEIRDAAGPAAEAALLLEVYESAVADATRRAEVARRDADAKEFVLDHARGSLERALKGTHADG